MLITYRGAPVALAGCQRVYLVPRIAQLPDSDPLKRFVAYLCLHAQAAMTGQRPYLPERAERVVRERLIPEDELDRRWQTSDAVLAQRFGVPVEQIAQRRRDLTGAPGQTDTSGP